MAEPGDYRHIRCEVCGHPWQGHPLECSRHAHRPGAETPTAAHDEVIPNLEAIRELAEIARRRPERSRRVREDLEIDSLDRDECEGLGRGGTLSCCDRAGENNGFGTGGPLAFLCPEGCSCHD